MLGLKGFIGQKAILKKAVTCCGSICFYCFSKQSLKNFNFDFVAKRSTNAKRNKDLVEADLPLR